MRKSIRERLQEAKRPQRKESLVLGSIMDILPIMLGDQPNPTQLKVITAQENIMGYMGPAGCAKTSTGCGMGFMRALFQPGCKGVVVRADYNDHFDTTITCMQKMLDNLPSGILLDRDKNPPMRWYIRPIIEGPVSQITFMGARGNTFGGLEADWIIVDEADELDETSAHLLRTRYNRNPSGFHKTLLFMFNPPRKDHWLYKACLGRDVQERKVGDPWIHLYVPQPEENAKHLDPDYYKNMEGLPDALRMRLKEGKWGATFTGTPVYPQFKHDIHVHDLEYDELLPTFRWWDFGYNHPVVFWVQERFDGGVDVIRELVESQKEIDALIPIVKAQEARHFGRVLEDVTDVGDAAVIQKKDTGSTLGRLAKHGIKMRYRRMNIDPTVKTVRECLSKLINGVPLIRFNRTGCPVLLDALRGGYKLKDGTDQPEKDGFYDNLADPLRYGLVDKYGILGEKRASSSSGKPTSVSYDPARDPRRMPPGGPTKTIEEFYSSHLKGRR